MLTDFDLKILREFSRLKNGEDVTTWDIMKKIFHDKKDSDLRNKQIKNRINRMAAFGLFSITRNSPTKYTLDSNKVYCKKFSYPDNKGKFEGIAVFLNDRGKWEIYEL